MEKSERDKLILKNMKLVGYVISKLCNVPQPIYDDAVAEGYLALCKAAYNYNPDLNISFSTYACTVIFRQVIQIVQNYNKYISRQNLNYSDVSNDKKQYYCIDFSIIDIYDMIEHIFDEPLTKQMIELRMQGYKYKEISNILGVAPEIISYKLKSTLSKYVTYKDKCNEQQN